MSSVFDELPVVERRLIDRICTRFEATWKQGSSPRLEDFLSEVAEPLRVHLLRELLLLDVDYRQRHGGTPKPADYSSRFPDYSDLITEICGSQANPAATADVPIHRPGPGPVKAPTATVPPALPGYEVLQELGRGGMGVVYRARQQAFDRLVALKVLLEGIHADAGALVRFWSEAQNIARLQHPNIVQVHDTGTFDGRPYLVMEYVAGGSLAAWLRGVPQPPDQAARLMAVIARAVQAAHDQHVVHRDLKPANILLVAAAPGTSLDALTPKVADFGLARRMDQDARLTAAGQTLGTPSYMAPEQASGHSHKSGALVDVYALGAILYELLTGRPPFAGVNAIETVIQVLRQEIVPPRRLRPAIPVDLETICLKCLNKVATRRYASAQALADDLDRFVQGQPIRARPVSRFERAAKWVRRHPAVSALTALVLIVTVAGVGGIAWKWQDEARARHDADDARTKEVKAHEATAAALDREKQAHEEAERRRLESDRWRLDLSLEKHLGLCERGHADLGLLGLTRDLVFAHTELPGESDNLQRILRRNIALWRSQLHTLKDIFPAEGAGKLGGLATDGNSFWTCEPENGVRVWAVDDCRPGSPLLKHDGPVRDLAVSADGQVIVTASGRFVHSWAAASGKPLGPPLEHPADVPRLALSRDGKTVLSACADQQVRVWSLTTGKRVGEPVALVGETRRVMFSPEGRRAVAWNDRSTARLIDAATGTPLGDAIRHPGPIHCAAFSPDGTTLALGGGNILNDGPVRLWPTDGGQPTGPLLRHSAAVESVAFSPDGRTLATGSYDRTARLWDAATGNPRGELLRHTATVGSVAFTPDGRLLATASFDATNGRKGVVRLWDVVSSSPVGPPLAHPGFPTALAVRPGGTTLASTCDDGRVRLWNISPWRTTGFPVPHPIGISHVAFIDGDTAVTVGWEGAWSLLSPVTGRPVGPGGRYPEGHMPLALAPGGRIGAVVSIEGRNPARLWEVATNRLIGEPLAPVSAVLPSAAFSADGKRLITNGPDGTARVWEAATGKPIGQPLAHGKMIHAVALSPDGTTALTTGMGVGRLWEVATGKSVGTAFEQTESTGFNVERVNFAFVAFLPGDRGFLTTDFKGRARMWDKAGRSMPLPGTGAKFVAISPDGDLVVTEAEDRAVRLWNVATGRQIGPSLVIDLPAARGFAAASPDEFWPHWYFSPDGRALAARRDQKGWVWPVPSPAQGEPADLRAWAEALTGLRLGNDDAPESLDPATWRARRRQADAAGLP